MRILAGEANDLRGGWISGSHVPGAFIKYAISVVLQGAFCTGYRIPSQGIWSRRAWAV